MLRQGCGIWCLSWCSVIAGGLLLVAASVPVCQAEDPLVLVSSFAGGADGGITAFRLQTSTARLTQVHRTAPVPQPFFFDVSPDRRQLFSIHAETFGGPATEQLASWKLDVATGQLTPINRRTTRGTASCFVEVDRTGRMVLCANYASGSVVAWRIQSDGSLSEPSAFVQHQGSSINPARQKEPHAHCFVISPDNRFAYAADLGTDQVLCYQLNPETGELQPAVQPFVRMIPGAGPRHLTFDPAGRHVYVINELLNSVTVFKFLPETGFLIEQQTISTLPVDFVGESYCADLKITPNGHFLYGTNRGHDSLAMYRIADDGRLTLIGIEPSGGKGPQNLAITRDGQLLLCGNMPGNRLMVFRIDQQTGRLTAQGNGVEIPGPSCIRILD